MNHSQPPSVIYQQNELDRIRQVQNQAILQQQMAVLGQHMVYYEQQLQNLPNENDCLSMNHESVPKVKRAEHNAIERARRETLNSKYQQLALSLPNLKDRRPSKGTILERTLEYVKATVQKEQAFQSQIDQLRQANHTLYSQMMISTDEEDSEEELSAYTPQDPHHAYFEKQQVTALLAADTLF
ncbi:hypothetical protein BY458DRAFT_504007 [Sporodiniella umbellata]|nr:hypothetical protein BY458DRAFT_504007 [Sporodiniella umbellata]